LAEARKKRKKGRELPKTPPGSPSHQPPPPSPPAGPSGTPVTLPPLWTGSASDEEFTELKPQDLEGPAYEIVKVFHPGVIHL
nr:hypothetical protein [Tanacetum cinerariifolium]